MIKNNKCSFQKVSTHNHTDDAHEEFIEMQSLCILNEHLKRKSENLKNSKIKLKNLIADIQNSDVAQKFKLDIVKNERKIYRLINKWKTTTESDKIVKKAKKSKVKKPMQIQSQLSLNALGKKILAVEDKFKHLLISEKNPQDANFENMENKTICKICFENESDRVFTPCGHSICKQCLELISETHKKKLQQKYKSQRVIKEKMKNLKCHKCRQTIKNTYKIYF